MGGDGAAAVPATVVATDDRAPVEGDDDGDPSIDLGRWRALAAAVLADEGVEGPAELHLAFVDERAMAQLNADFMGETGPTDVLSFPLDADAAPGARATLRLLGDVVICPAVAARNAGGATVHDAEGLDAEGLDAEGLDAEIALLVVHGVLHVLGMDHAEADEAAAMAARERHHLGAVGLDRRS